MGKWLLWLEGNIWYAPCCIHTVIKTLVLAERPKEATKGGRSKKEGGSDDANYDIGLQDVGDGTGIVTRFPPEPS